MLTHHIIKSLQGIWDKRVHHSNVYTFKDYNENKKSLPIHRPDRSHIVQDLALKLKQKKYPHSIFFNFSSYRKNKVLFFQQDVPTNFLNYFIDELGKHGKTNSSIGFFKMYFLGPRQKVQLVHYERTRFCPHLKTQPSKSLFKIIPVC